MVWVSWCGAFSCLETAVRRWVHGGHKAMIWSAAILRQSCSQLVPKVCQQHILHQQPESLIQARVDPSFHVVWIRFWPYRLNVTAETVAHRASQHFCSLCYPVLVSLCELNGLILIYLFLLSWSSQSNYIYTTCLIHTSTSKLKCKLINIHSHSQSDERIWGQLGVSIFPKDIWQADWSQGSNHQPSNQKVICSTT